MSSVTRCGAFAPGTSTAPITRSACATSRSIARRLDIDRLDPPAPDLVDEPQPVDVLVDDRDLRLHARRDPRGVRPGHARAQHHDARRRDARGAAHQHAAPALGPLEVGRAARAGPSGRRSRDIGASSGSRPSGSCTVSYATRGDLALREEPREPLVGRQVEVREQDLALAEPLVLLRLRLLHLEDHVGGGEDGIGVRRGSRHPPTRSPRPGAPSRHLPRSRPRRGVPRARARGRPPASPRPGTRCP